MEHRPYNYATYELCLKSDFVDVADALASGWVFRGQADTSWDISSTLEREMERFKNEDRAAYEASVLKQVKSVGPLDHGATRRPTDDFSWLALLQHHGCKTRLVDFTESFYVALFFAVRDCPKSDAAVWAISTSEMDATIRSICERRNNELSGEEMPRRLVNNSIELPERYRDDESLAIVCGNPHHLNQRMIAQQGVFLCPLNLNTSFMENLTLGLALTGKKEAPKRLNTLEDLEDESKAGKVIKIKLLASQHRDLLFHLRKMNITEATLFPGLDGYARSLNYFAIERE